MDILVSSLTKANEAYRNGQPLLMTDEEYDAGMELLASKVPHHPLLKKVRAAPTPLAKGGRGTIVKMPFYLGSLDKAKVADELDKWTKKTPSDAYIVSDKLDGITSLWNPSQAKLYLSGDDDSGLDVSAWLPFLNKGHATAYDDVPEDVWIRGELIMPKKSVPPGRLGRSIVNGIFHHSAPDPAEAKKVHLVSYEVIGMAEGLTVRQQFSWITNWGLLSPYTFISKSPSADALTKVLAERRQAGEYDIDGLVIRSNKTLPRVAKGNPKDAVAWKPPNGEAKLTKVLEVEWNASSTGKLIPRVKIEPVSLGGSTINYVTGVNARRVTDWKIGPGATVVLRKGGDVIPVIDSVEIPATVTYPPADTWEWDGTDPLVASNIKQKVADASTTTAQFMKMVTRLGWDKIGPAQMKAVVEAGYTTVPLLRKASEADLKKLLGPVKGAHLYKTIQTDGWEGANEIDLFVASPLCPSGVGITKLDVLKITEPDCTKWGSPTMIAPKGWTVDSLRDFQKVWIAYEEFRMKEWSFLPYPVPVPVPSTVAPSVAAPKPILGSVVFSGIRDKAVEAALEAKGYKVVDAVKSDTKAVVIADGEDPSTYVSTKTEKAKKIPGCKVLRRADWEQI
jgi:NAD-dependent DNA ligase